MIAAAGLVAMATGFAGQAQAVTPACGDVLTANAIFDSDLNCSAFLGSVGTPVDGLTVGADNVTINLKGFSLIGPASFGVPFAGAPSAVSAECPAGFNDTPNRTIGIRVDGFNNVNILNGIIEGFEFGIMVKNAAGVGIKDIEAFNNAFNALSVGDFDSVLTTDRGGVPDLVVNRVNFHNNRNDAVGVSPDSSMSMLNSHVKDNCASGIFVAPLSFAPPSPTGTPKANADIKHSSFEGNLRSAVNFWGGTGSVEHSLIKGNNADTSFSSSSDFGQISLTNLEGGDISIRCNDIRDSLDANSNAIERGIGFRGSFTPNTTSVEVTKNLFTNNTVAIHFSTDGSFVTVDIHKNTFDTNTTDFELVNNTWTVDADKNFYGGGDPAITNAGSTLTTASVLKSAQHCRGSKGVPQ